MSLIAVCRCGAEAPSAEMKGGLCVECRATDACAADRVDLIRLHRKRQRYEAAGASVANTDQQARRVRERMHRKCAEIDPARAHELSVRQAELAGKEARGRILLPQEA